MNRKQLEKLAASTAQTSKTGLLRRRAIYDILENSKKIENYVSEPDQINQAADKLRTTWLKAYQYSKDHKFLEFISVADSIKSSMMSVNHAETYFRNVTFNTFEEMLKYAKKCDRADEVSYDVLRQVFEIKELNRDYQNREL